MPRFRSLLAFFVIAVTALSAQGQDSRGGWAPPVDLRPTLVIRAYASYPERSSMSAMTSSIELVTGSYQSFLFTPQFQSRNELCMSSMQVAVNPAGLDQADAAWLIDARLVDLRQGDATIDLRWKRVVNRADIAPSGTYEFEQRLTLRDGDSGVLDVVRSTGAGPTGCRVFGLAYDLRLEGAPRLADAAIEYDLWLVHSDSHGRQVTDQYRTGARQGESAEYFFRPVGFAADGEQDSTHPAMDLRVAGTLRGRLRPDGRIDLAVDGKSSVISTDGSGGVTRFGRTLLTVSEGETVEVELPPIAGTITGVGDVGQTFTGQRTAIRITARRVW
jgi:hypothetical protein